MIIGDFYFVGITIVPVEYDSPLIIDSDAVKVTQIAISYSSLLAGGIDKSLILIELFLSLGFLLDIS